MNRNWNIFFLTILIFFLIIPWASQIKSQSTLLENTHSQLTILNGVTLSINGDSALGAAANGGGNGTIGNPFIVKNKIINASGTGTYGIFIRNTNAYFILRNCTVTNAHFPYSAVYFCNVTHARLENINASNNQGTGIGLNSSSLVTLVNTTASDNYNVGVWLLKCLSINLTNTIVNRNNYGLGLDYSNSTTISGINACNNDQDGISFHGSIYPTLTGATANNNGYGINLRSCNYSTIHGNTANNNKYVGIRLALSNSNGFAGNHLNSNGIGIELASSNYNIVTGNILYNNSQCITETDCTGNILENNDCGNPGIQWYIYVIIIMAIIGLVLGLFILYRRRGLKKTP